jgi:adenylosuccinate lyase
MIDRYTRPEMGHIFSLENKYAIWQEIEVLACEAQAELGKIGITKEEARLDSQPRRLRQGRGRRHRGRHQP